MHHLISVMIAVCFGVIISCTQKVTPISELRSAVAEDSPTEKRFHRDSDEGVLARLNGRPNFHTPGEFHVIEVATSYIEAGSLGDVEHELSFYAPVVDFYGQGRKKRKDIKNELTKLNQKWNLRTYKVSKINSVRVRHEEKTALISLSFDYTLSNDDDSRSGTANSLISFDYSSGEYLVDKVQEQKVRP